MNSSKQDSQDTQPKRPNMDHLPIEVVAGIVLLEARVAATSWIVSRPFMDVDGDI